MTTVKRQDYQPIYEKRRRRQRRWRRLGALVLTLVVVGLGIWGWRTWQSYQQARLARYPIHGVTINQDSGYLDFQQLAKNNQFVYIQATSGATYSDNDFSNNYSRAQGAEIKVGVVHTFSFSTSASRQLHHFNQTVGRQTGTLPIMVAVSYYDQYNSSNQDMAAQGQKLKKIVTALETTYQQGVVIYANKTVLTQFVRPVLPNQDEWMADGHLGHYDSPVQLIEYNASGKLSQNGQSQAVGFTVFNGTQRQWTKFSQQN
ncbi:Lyzozyme M1 (1,4-beta-N-acetylmuramidase) [Levilactobacillus acidifarinae DSM 19394]|uniref:Lyzozyme M1 (1,4-beta-N-acetylmuramidase) n=1 Tax=Levilactobacillus acidifarinae DSM 19394 = JCM 15949 TaxID=1423715 RepID=A0A0R1LYF7_9LACO|nr:Lyzozyme M1 (1,4-beta-N-acetylmuramidase) [Levilactobacillus acidifarinae DSM 19394]